MLSQIIRHLCYLLGLSRVMSSLVTLPQLAKGLDKKSDVLPVSLRIKDFQDGNTNKRGPSLHDPFPS
jgi:hypothetical protein